ncbi:MAG TPA: hypothetical protein VFV02_15950, partial [Acidimicrobiales bacterium]|nr:hypothetical protein [Acidimicrobiales bacterium]
EQRSGERTMWFGRIGVLLVAMAALNGLLASAAFGAIKTEAAQLYVEDTKGTQTTLPTGTSRVATQKIVKHTETELGAKFTFRAKIGSPEGPFVHLTATGLNCIGCKAENKVTSTGASVIATGAVKLEYTGVTAMEPEGCVVSSETGVKGTMVTKPLTLHMDWMHEGKAFVSLFPTSGTTFAQIRVNEGGCTAIAGAYNVTGTIFGEAKSKTGVFNTESQVETSPAIQKTTGAELKVGGNLAEVTGTSATSIRNAANTANVPFSVK